MEKLYQLERLKKVHKLIQQQNTGNSKEFSKKLGISERSFFRILDSLKEWDAPICYDKKGYTYYYTKDFDLEINISIHALSNGEKIKIYGGQTLKNNRLQGFGSISIYI